MDRRQVLLGTGAAAVATLAGCLSSDDESNGDGNDDVGSGGSDADFTAVYNFRQFDELQTPDNDGVFYESDDETQYVGVQLEVTNHMGREASVGEFELSVLVDGDTDGVAMHAQSQTEPLAGIKADKTVGTWMFFSAPPGVGDEDLGFGETEWTENSFELVHDEDLEIELEERSE